MKKIILLSFALFTMISYGQNKVNKQNIKVTYEFLSNKSDFPKPYTYLFNTYLLINDSIAQYVFNKEAKVVREGKFQTEIGELKYINNYSFKDKEMEEQRSLKKGKIKAKWKPDYNWQITDETKKINGYTVRKALTNSVEIDPNVGGYYGKAIAWFTEEIPLPVGPNRYCGLPGLILELEYEYSVKKATLKKIEFGVEQKQQSIREGSLLEDKRDVIYFFHKDASKVKKALRNN